MSNIRLFHPENIIENKSSNKFSKLLLFTSSFRRAGVPFERIATLNSFSLSDLKTSGT